MKKQLSNLLPLLLPLFLWLSATSCYGASELNNNGKHLTFVSMIELIANPEKFDGKRVVVAGFVHFEFEGNTLYLHEEDYHADLWQNGLALAVTSKQLKINSACNLRYCSVTATFHAIRPHSFSLWSGSLTDISELQVLPTLGSRAASSKPRLGNKVLTDTEPMLERQDNIK